MWKSHLQPVNMEKGLCCGACVYHTQHGQKKEEKMYGGKTMPINDWKWTDDESEMDIATCKHKQMDSKSAHKNSSWLTNITYLIYNTIYLSMLNVLNVAVSTVCNIVKKFTACGTGADHPWRGRKRKIYERLQQRIVWTLDIEPPSTSKQIQVVLQTPGTTVSARTIRCHLNKKGHDGRRPRRIPLLTQEKKKKKKPDGGGSLMFWVALLLQALDVLTVCMAIWNLKTTKEFRGEITRPGSESWASVRGHGSYSRMMMHSILLKSPKHG